MAGPAPGLPLPVPVPTTSALASSTTITDTMLATADASSSACPSSAEPTPPLPAPVPTHDPVGEDGLAPSMAEPCRQPLAPLPALCCVVAYSDVAPRFQAGVLDQVRAASLDVFFESKYVDEVPTRTSGASRFAWRLDLVFDAAAPVTASAVAAANAVASGSEPESEPESEISEPAAQPEVYGFILYRLGGELADAKHLVGISKLWVNEGVRCRGLGHVLVKRAISWAKSHRALYVTLWAYNDAIRFYRNMGFKLGIASEDSIAAQAEGTFHNEVSKYMEKFVGTRKQRKDMNRGISSRRNKRKNRTRYR